MRLLFLSVLLVQSATAAAVPALIGPSSNLQCRAALAMARERFGGTSPTLIWPLPNSEKTGNSIVLAQAREDISGGHDLVADPGTFTETAVEKENYKQYLYIQRPGRGARRIVLLDSPSGWRGDRFGSSLIADHDSSADVVRSLISNGNGASLASQVLTEESWLPPIVLKSNRDGLVWMLSRGQSWEALADWTVFIPELSGSTPACTVTFSVSGRQGLALLPSEVRWLATALDDALGPGRDDGTLQQTAGIRRWTEKLWVNAAVRPWALTSSPYNDRGRINKELALWARTSPSFGVVEQRIRRGYRPAQSALAKYYQRRFGLPPGKARAFAAFALDHIMRQYFVYPGGETGASVTTVPVVNAWPGHRR